MGKGRIFVKLMGHFSFRVLQLITTIYIYRLISISIVRSITDYEKFLIRIILVIIQINCIKDTDSTSFISVTLGTPRELVHVYKCRYIYIHLCFAALLYSHRAKEKEPGLRFRFSELLCHYTCEMYIFSMCVVERRENRSAICVLAMRRERENFLRKIQNCGVGERRISRVVADVTESN